VTIPSVASRRFWQAFRSLPREIRKQATAAYRLWQHDAFHPSLHFKKVGPDLWSVRVGMQYRALARFEGNVLVWTWIGTHADYDQLLR
jgi:plasmid maintenance system killer protein